MKARVRGGDSGGVPMARSDAGRQSVLRVYIRWTDGSGARQGRCDNKASDVTAVCMVQVGEDAQTGRSVTTTRHCQAYAWTHLGSRPSCDQWPERCMRNGKKLQGPLGTGSSEPTVRSDETEVASPSATSSCSTRQRDADKLLQEICPRASSYRFQKVRMNRALQLNHIRQPRRESRKAYRVNPNSALHDP